MSPERILQPVSVLVIWTFCVGVLVPIRRVGAAFRGEVTPEDFKYGESERVPNAVSLPNRNLMNLLEVPLLFYVACLTLYVTHHVDLLVCVLAWAFVALRVGHSLVHLTSNHIIHRMTFYGLSNFALMGMWFRLCLWLW